MRDRPAARLNAAEAGQDAAGLVAGLRDPAGRTAAAYGHALETLSNLFAHDAEEAASLYSDIIKTTEWDSRHTAVLTPRLLQIFDEFGMAASNKCALHALEGLMSYARHHMEERHIVIEQAGEVIVRRAEASQNYDGKSIPALVTKLVDTARIYSDEDLLPVAFNAGWRAIAHMHPERTDDCHAIAQRMYGVAFHNEAYEDFIRTGRKALPEMMIKNRSAVIITARVLEQASTAAVNGRMFFEAAREGFLTPAFARTGRLANSDKERWFFPAVGGRWDERIITMVPEHLESARREIIVSPNLSGADFSRINHVFSVFTDVANGILTPQRAAERINVSADHLKLDAWK